MNTAEKPKSNASTTAAEEYCAPEEAQRTIRKLTSVGVGGNIALAAFKLLMGILGNSMAMISDAVHSLSDVLATAIAYAGSRIAQREADNDHPYGHERFECLASLLLGAILFATAAGIGWAGISALSSGSWRESEPGALALAGAIVSIATKEAMFQYTLRNAKRIKSEAFQADAWHHRSDALSSIGALVGIACAMAGIGWADAAASLVICLFVFKVAFEIAKGAVDNMLDTPADKATEASIESCIAAVEGVQRIDLLLTRRFGNRVYVDAEIAVRGSMSLCDAHEIAERAHDRVEQKFPAVKHIMIHVNPC